MNTKIVLIIIMLVAISTISYIVLSTKDTAPAEDSTNNMDTVFEKSPLILQGTVTNVNANNMQIIVQISSTSPLKTVTISQETKIEKVISQKNGEGVTEKQALVEINIDELQTGNQVTVVYRSEKDEALSGVDRVIFVVDGNVDEYFRSQTNNQNYYIRAQVLSIDMVQKNLIYKPYFLNAIGTTTTNILISDGIPTYKINDPARISITYARTNIALTDIRSGQDIFIKLNPESLKTDKIVAEELIILAE
jgi:hypothetical protein